MTGSVMNGYAESLFINMWAVSEDFRKEFDRDESQRFVNRFGYRKRIVEDKDAKGDVVEFGSQSDRVVRSERVIGNAPGVLPLFLLRHLLPVSVTLHKADLALDLPANKLIRFQVKPTDEHKKRYDKLKDALVRQIKHDRYEPDVAGKLFGQLAELPSYLDRATNDVGNDEDGAFRICYPESLESKIVAEQPGFSAKTILEKEAWLLDLLDVELAQGRNVMVFTWHLNLITRLAGLIKNRTGEAPAILLADKVPTAKRQDWIDKNVVRPNKRVLLANPVAIQTGLNNLVHFHSQAWMENPACNPTTFRQAMGRIDRIGQTKETRVFFPVYEGTLQEALYDLLMKKVAIGISTDGLDNESALTAAGMGTDEALTGLSIGKALWQLIGGLGDEEDRPTRRKAASR
jgi:SNF2 family DNA or RNA helicase